MKLAYILKRLLYMIPTLIGVNLFVFALFFLVNTPNDMAREALGEKGVTPEQVENWKAAHGYDKPSFWNSEEAGLGCITETLFYRKSLSLFWGDFGRADMSGELISHELATRVGPSVWVSLPIFLATLLLNIFIAMQCCRHRGQLLDTGMQAGCVILMSVSTLIYIIAAQYVMGRVMRIVPVSGYGTGEGRWLFLAMPIVIGVLGNLGSGVRLYRTLFMEEVGKDYVRTARAKGISENKVFFVHVLKNAMIPILTNVPMQLLMLMTGNMLLENFFSIPGLGGYTIYAISAQDFSITRVMVFLGSVLYMFGMLLADICYGLVDPRVRVGAKQ